MNTQHTQIDNQNSLLRSAILSSVFIFLSIVFCLQPVLANPVAPDSAVDSGGESRAWKQSNVAALAGANAHSPFYQESHALLIGASNYETWPQLSSIPTELDEVQTTLEAQNFEVERLVDPNSQDLKQGIEQFIREYGYDSENRLLIFFSGHGHSMNEKGFILPVDTPLPEDRKAFRRAALPMTQVVAWARDIESKHVLFLFDSCFSGSIFTNKSMVSADDRYVRKAVSQPVRQFITAGGEDDEVPAKSTFTPMLVDALKGKGDLNGDGYVTGSELGLYLVQQVPRYVNQTPQYGKIRDYSLSKGDFVFTPTKKPTAVKIANNAQRSNANVQKRSIYNQELGFELELELWRSAKEFGGEDDFKEYLRQYPNGKFAGIARNRLSVIKGRGDTISRIESAPMVEHEATWQSVPRRKSPAKDEGLVEDDEQWQLVPGGKLNTQSAIPANVLVQPVGDWAQ